jgi:hypothetical protein
VNFHGPAAESSAVDEPQAARDRRANASEAASKGLRAVLRRRVIRAA